MVNTIEVPKIYADSFDYRTKEIYHRRRLQNLDEIIDLTYKGIGFLRCKADYLGKLDEMDFPAIDLGNTGNYVYRLTSLENPTIIIPKKDFTQDIMKAIRQQKETMYTVDYIGVLTKLFHDKERLLSIDKRKLFIIKRLLNAIWLFLDDQQIRDFDEWTEYVDTYLLSESIVSDEPEFERFDEKYTESQYRKQRREGKPVKKTRIKDERYYD